MFAYVVLLSIDLTTVLALKRFHVAGATPKNTTAGIVLVTFRRSRKLKVKRRNLTWKLWD